MLLFKKLKFFMKITFIYIFIFELIFQACFLFNLNEIKKPALYYNGFCDQNYWNLINNKITYNNNTEYHPVLSLVKKNLKIPKQIPKKMNSDVVSFIKNEVSIYGSSYNNHKDFIKLFVENENISFKNYSLESYGLDQIYLSYKLTAHLNQNKTIIIGFLLEDLDRSLFSKREYQKALFVKKNKDFIVENIPINQNKKIPLNIDFYLFKFIKNFYNLIMNDFDPRQSVCNIEEKKELLEFFIDDIINLSSHYNQKIIIITYNLKEDLVKKPTWRYSFIADYLKKNKIIHIDSYKILKKESLDDAKKIDTYFGLDKHNNEKSFRYIFDKLLPFL